MKPILVTCLFLLSVAYSGSVQSQDILKSLESKNAGEGVVVIHQDARIKNLIGSERNKDVTTSPVSGDESSADISEVTTGKKVFKTTGYRVQIYAGNNTRQGQEEALKKAAQVKDFLRGMPVYAYFQTPRWLCRVGDFKNIEEADAVMRKLKTSPLFKEVSIVRDQINIVY